MTIKKKIRPSEQLNRQTIDRFCSMFMLVDISHLVRQRVRTEKKYRCS